MGFAAWSARHESLGVFLHPSAQALAYPLHQRLGDCLHRVCVRDARVPLVVSFSAAMPLRGVAAVLCTGGRVACLAQDDDDLAPFLRRLCLVAPAMAEIVSCAYYDRDQCVFEGTLRELMYSVVTYV